MAASFEQVVAYVKKYRALGYSDAQLQQALQKNGVDPSIVSRALQAGAQAMSTQAQSMQTSVGVQAKTSPFGKKPFYKTWWFYTIIGAVLLLALITAGVVVFSSDVDEDECSNDDDCGSDEECSRGSCVEVDEDEDDVDSEGDDADEDDTSSESDGDSAACADDDDCAGGDVCTDGVCEEEAECGDDDDCGDGEYCSDDESCEIYTCADGEDNDEDELYDYYGACEDEDGVVSACVDEDCEEECDDVEGSYLEADDDCTGLETNEEEDDETAEPNYLVDDVGLTALTYSSATFEVNVTNDGDATNSDSFAVLCTLTDENGGTYSDLVEIDGVDYDDMESVNCAIAVGDVYDLLANDTDTTNITLAVTVDYNEEVDELDETDNEFTYEVTWDQSSFDVDCADNDDCSDGTCSADFRCEAYLCADSLDNGGDGYCDYEGCCSDASYTDQTSCEDLSETWYDADDECTAADTDEEEDADGTSTLGESCNTNDECSIDDGEYCGTEDVCVECEDDSECGGGTCTDNACVAQECDYSTSCDSGYYCSVSIDALWDYANDGSFTSECVESSAVCEEDDSGDDSEEGSYLTGVIESSEASEGSVYADYYDYCLGDTGECDPDTEACDILVEWTCSDSATAAASTYTCSDEGPSYTCLYDEDGYAYCGEGVEPDCSYALVQGEYVQFDDFFIGFLGYNTEATSYMAIDMNGLIEQFSADDSMDDTDDAGEDVTVQFTEYSEADATASIDLYYSVDSCPDAVTVECVDGEDNDGDDEYDVMGRCYTGTTEVNCAAAGYITESGCDTYCESVLGGDIYVRGSGEEYCDSYLDESETDEEATPASYAPYYGLDYCESDDDCSGDYETCTSFICYTSECYDGVDNDGDSYIDVGGCDTDADDIPDYYCGCYAEDADYVPIFSEFKSYTEWAADGCMDATEDFGCTRDTLSIVNGYCGVGQDIEGTWINPDPDCSSFDDNGEEEDASSLAYAPRVEQGFFAKIWSAVAAFFGGLF